MRRQHADLASDRWKEMSLPEQLANIGSEVGRALSWRSKGNEEYSLKAAVRALELIDLSLDSGGPFPRLREMARLREAVVDYFWGDNEFSSSEDLWRGYFDRFNYLAQKRRAR
jgi:hypothetical protein